MMGPQASSFPATKPALSCDRSMCTIARQISSKQLCIPRLIYASSGASGIICITKRASPDLDKVPSASFALQDQKLPASLEPCAVELLSLFPTHICNQRHHSTQMKFRDKTADELLLFTNEYGVRFEGRCFVSFPNAKQIHLKVL